MSNLTRQPKPNGWGRAPTAADLRSTKAVLSHLAKHGVPPLDKWDNYVVQETVSVLDMLISEANTHGS